MMSELKDIPRRLLVLNSVSAFVLGVVLVYLLLGLTSVPPFRLEELTADTEKANDMAFLKLVIKGRMQVLNNHAEILRVFTILAILALGLNCASCSIPAPR